MTTEFSCSQRDASLQTRQVEGDEPLDSATLKHPNSFSTWRRSSSLPFLRLPSSPRRCTVRPDCRASVKVPSASLSAKSTEFCEIQAHEVEPVLQYSHFYPDVSHRLPSADNAPTGPYTISSSADASITAFAVSNACFAVGHASGSVELLTLDGVCFYRLADHTEKVTDLSFNAVGDCFGSCGADGLVLLYLLTFKRLNARSSEQSERELCNCQPLYNFCSPSSCLCLSVSPRLTTNDSPALAVSGNVEGELLLHHREEFYTTTQTLHCQEGSITAVSWNPENTIVAWANSLGVKLMDVVSLQKISFVPTPYETSQKMKPLTFVSWLSHDSIVIVFEKTVKIGHLQTKTSSSDTVCVNRENVRNRAARLYLEIIMTLNITEGLVCGAAALRLPASMTSGLKQMPSNYLSIYTVPQNESHEIADEEQHNDSRHGDNLSILHPSGPLQLTHHIVRQDDASIVFSDSLSFLTDSFFDKEKVLKVVAGPGLTNCVITTGGVIQVTPAEREACIRSHLLTENFEKALAAASSPPDVDLLQDVLSLSLKHLLSTNRKKDLDRAVHLIWLLNLDDFPELIKLTIDIMDSFDKLPLLIPVLPHAPSKASTNAATTVAPNWAFWLEKAEDVGLRLLQKYPAVFRREIVCSKSWLWPLLDDMEAKQRLISELLKILNYKQADAKVSQPPNTNHCGDREAGTSDLTLLQTADTFQIPLCKRLEKTGKPMRGMAQRLRLEALGLLLESTNQFLEPFKLYILAESHQLLFSLVSRFLHNPNVDPRTRKEAANGILEALNELFRLDAQKISQILAAELARSEEDKSQPILSPSKIAQALQSNRHNLYCYLREGFRLAPRALSAFRAQYISLLAEYDTEHLLEFLQQLQKLNSLTNPNYALAVCRRRRADLASPISTQLGNIGLVPRVKRQKQQPKHRAKKTRRYATSASSTQKTECDSHTQIDTTSNIRDLLTAEVFLLYYMGRTKDALQTLLVDLKDVLAAMDLVMLDKNLDLLPTLMDAIQRNPNFLEQVLTQVDASQLCSEPPLTTVPNSFSEAVIFGNTPSFVPYKLPIAPVHILRRLPPASFERIPNITEKLRKLFEDLADQEVFLNTCYDCTLEDYSNFGKDFVLSLKKGVHVVTASDSWPTISSSFTPEDYEQGPNRQNESPASLSLSSKVLHPISRPSAQAVANRFSPSHVSSSTLRGTPLVLPVMSFFNKRLAEPSDNVVNAIGPALSTPESHQATVAPYPVKSVASSVPSSGQLGWCRFLAEATDDLKLLSLWDQLCLERNTPPHVDLVSPLCTDVAKDTEGKTSTATETPSLPTDALKSSPLSGYGLRSLMAQAGHSIFARRAVSGKALNGRQQLRWNFSNGKSHGLISTDACTSEPSPITEGSKRHVALWLSQASKCTICGRPPTAAFQEAPWHVPHANLCSDVGAQREVDRPPAISLCPHSTSQFYIFHCGHAAHKDCYTAVASRLDVWRSFSSTINHPPSLDRAEWPCFLCAKLCHVSLS